MTTTVFHPATIQLLRLQSRGRRRRMKTLQKKAVVVGRGGWSSRRLPVYWPSFVSAMRP